MAHPRRIGAVSLVAVLVWAALWAVVFALDPGFGYADQPALLIALTVLPQLLLGYLVGPKAVLCVVPLAVAWALIVHADCTSSTSIDGECSATLAGHFGIGAVWAVIWGGLVLLGHGLRVGFAKRRGRPV